MQNNELDMNKSFQLKEICQKAESILNKSNVDQFEIFCAGTIENEIEIFNGEIETLSYSDTIGIGIRVFKDKSVGYSYTTVLDEDNLNSAIEKAVLNSRISKKEEFNFLPDKKESRYKNKFIGNNELFDEAFTYVTSKERVEIAKKLEELTRHQDDRIKSIDTLIYNDGITDVVLLNSCGFFDSYRSSVCFAYVNAISRSGEEISTGDYFGCSRAPKKLNLEEIAKNAAQRSVSILGGKKIKSQKLDLLLDNMVASQFLGIISGIITADSVQKNRSLFKGKIGEKIFNVNVNIYDDGTLKDGLSSKPFDGEGIIKGKTPVFENGYLKTYLYDTYTARKDNQLSTGNAVRASYRSTPSVGISNFYMEKSSLSFSQILSEIDKGFYVVDIIGLHSGTNPVSGQISVGAKGIFIENGNFSFPIKEVTIATDILTFCKSIAAVGDDLRFIPSAGYIGSPSVLVKDISVSGI